METLLILLILASFVLFVIGMISPKKAVPFNFPKKRGTVALIYLSAFVLFFILFGVFYAEEETTPKPVATERPHIQEQQPSGNIQPLEQPNQSQPEVKPTEQSEQSKAEESTIGKTFQVGHFEYTINAVRFKKTIGDEFFSETADGIYMLVDLTIKNIDNKTRTLDNSLFAVTDKNGVQFDYSSDGSTALELSGGKTLFLKDCHPGIATKGTLVFEVPEKGEYYIYLTGRQSGSRYVRVLLK